MAVDHHDAHVPEGIDPNASPFESPPIESLPLTKKERAELRRVIEELKRAKAPRVEP